MKAYYAHIYDDDDAGGEIIFANTAREAKKMAYGREFTSQLESYIYLRVNRDKRYDGLEKLSYAELYCKCWRDGWRWYDTNCPDVEEATDAEFIKWYGDNFGYTAPAKDTESMGGDNKLNNGEKNEQ